MVPVERARPEEREAALGLLCQHLDASARRDRVAQALRMLNQGQIDPDRLLVVRRQAVVGAVVGTLLPGAAGLIWPPRVAAGHPAPLLEDALLQQVLRELRQAGACFVQCLLAPHEMFLAPALVRNGFRHVTDLWFLRHDLAFAFGEKPPRDIPAVRTYTPAHADLFRQTLMRTYEGSLDCPEVAGVRTAEQIVEGHRAEGVFDPSRWWLAFAGEDPAAVILLAAMPDEGGWDVTYVGVVPEHRRRGLGRQLLRRAMRAALDAGAGQLTLSVDDRNRPAWNLYVDLGFRPLEKRHVYLAFRP